jgi:putative oxidoreductase
VVEWESLSADWQPRVLSVFRFVAGLLYVQHGLAKVVGFPVLAHHVPYHLFSLVPGAAGILELVGGGLIVLGLFTRPVAFVLSGEMAFAYFMAHAPRALFPIQNGGGLAILFCFAFLYLFVAGGGAWSLDRLRRPRTSAGVAAPSRA